MSESRRSPIVDADGQPVSTIRRQLIWAALFPLVTFGFLAVGLIVTTVNTFALQSTNERNTALVEAASARTMADLVQVQSAFAGALAQAADLRPASLVSGTAELLSTAQGSVVFVDSEGQPVAADPPGPASLDSRVLTQETVQSIRSRLKPVVMLAEPMGANTSPAFIIAIPVVRDGAYTGALVAWIPSDPVIQHARSGMNTPTSSQFSLVHHPWTNTLQGETQSLIASAPLGDTGWDLVIEQPRESTLAASTNVIWTLASLIAIGVVLSLVMLSVNVNRVTRPLAELSGQADQLGPGSTFRPIAEQGPAELRALIRAFNHLVIRLAEQQAAVRQYAYKAMLSQEEERQRISHELHDETIQDIVGFVQRVDLCRDEMEHEPTQARNRLTELRSIAEQVLDDLRRISNALRPSILQDLGLPSAIQSLCDDLRRQLPDAVCICDFSGEQRRLSPPMELAVYRVVQEALNNIRRHAKQVSRIQVVLRITAQDVIASIHDDGPGFVVTTDRQFVRDGHLGLVGMAERARAFGGEVKITTFPGRGTTIELTLPLPDE